MARIFDPDPFAVARRRPILERRTRVLRAEGIRRWWTFTRCRARDRRSRWRCRSLGYLPVRLGRFIFFQHAIDAIFGAIDEVFELRDLVVAEHCAETVGD